MKTVPILLGLSLIAVSCQSTTPTPTPVVKLTPKPTPAIAKTSLPKIKPYPLEKCLVTDEPLDEWDDIQTTVYKGQEMKFCCKMCLKKFQKDPEKYLNQLTNTDV